ncbi:Imm1 family immunity protein [Longispora albida]|uniref:Imm1 family immunity protein n=1 Tax=Longispora albida TaxID=203523 RepID=UPI00037FDFCA|nr:Imm1 family immunity protein [Longispora albida]
MILNAFIHGQLSYAETWPDMQALIDEALSTLEAESLSPHYDPGEDAWFMLSDRRHTGTGADWPQLMLHVSVNRATGYGAVIWLASGDYPGEGDIFDNAWVSDNPQPPAFDPRVVASPGEPRFHDPRSTVPIEQVRAVLEEFCRTGTGMRPEGVSWARSELNGIRFDGDNTTGAAIDR